MKPYYWNDTVITSSGERLNLVICFEVNDAGESIGVSPKIYWKEQLGYVYEIPELFFNSKYGCKHTFHNGLSVKVFFECSSRPIHHNTHYTISGELWVTKPELNSNELIRHYIGVFSEFVSNNGPAPYPAPAPSPTPLPEYADEDKPIVPDVNNTNRLGIELGLTSGSYHELFSYIYLTPWPTTPTVDVHDSFITIPSHVESSSDFYKKLADLNNVELIEKNATYLINTTTVSSTSSLFTDRFISELSQLQDTFKSYSKIHQIFQSENALNYEFIQEIVTEYYQSWENYNSLTQEEQYQTDEKNIWASITALIVLTGYKTKLLQQFIGLLRVQKVLSNTSVMINKNQLKEKQLIKWWESSLVAPKKIFPLPTLSTKVKSPPNQNQPLKGSINPYGIGFLQTVLFELKSYELGEIRHIENILKGETREVKQRELTTKETHEIEEVRDTKALDERSEDTTNDLVKEVYKTLIDRKVETKIIDYKTNYGDPTSEQADITGNWWVNESPAGGNKQDISKFAKDIVYQTTKRVSNQITRERRDKKLSETELVKISKFDNTSGDKNISGFYQWLNKLYNLSTEPLGNRLVVELKFENPAASFIDTLSEYYDIELEVPISPEEYGLSSYQDIELDNIQSPPQKRKSKLYYLTLLQQYQIYEYTLPPEKNKYINKAIQSERPLSVVNAAIPEGFLVKSVFINIIHVNKNVDTDIMVGAQSIKYNPQTPSQGAQIDINDTMESISVSILCKQQVNSPPSESEFISQYAANIKIELTPLETTIDLWKIGIYNSIQKAYQNQLKKYYEQMKRQEQQILVNNPNLYEQLKKGQLITKSIELLFAKAQQLVNLDIDSFKYNQYFKNSLDWDSMLCHFTQDKDKINYNENIFLKELDSLIHFRNFIRAKSVLILLPVHSIHTFSFIYFLNTGNIWQGKDTDCPVIHQSIQLCNELKKIENKENEGRKEEWTITIPTSMSVLSKSDNLPNL